MTRLQQQLKDSREQLITLRYTKTIQPDDLKLPEWMLLSEEYKLGDGAPRDLKVITSILNSCLLQHRLVFVLTRRTLRRVVEEDENWAKRGFRNNQYTEILRTMHTCGIFERISQEDSQKPSIWKIIDPEWTALIAVDANAQAKEALQFIQNNGDHKGDQLGNRNGDQDLEQEREVFSGRVSPNGPDTSPLKTTNPLPTRESAVQAFFAEHPEEIRAANTPVADMADSDWCKRVDKPLIQGNQ